MGADESGRRHGVGPAATLATDFLAADSLLSDEQLLLRDTVRRWVGERVLPHQRRLRTRPRRRPTGRTWALEETVLA